MRDRQRRDRRCSPLCRAEGERVLRERRRISILLEDAGGTELIVLKRSPGLVTERV